MKYFLRLLCFAFMYGIYIADDGLYLFMQQHRRPPPPKCPPNEAFTICLSNCSNCEQRGFCVLKDCNINGCDCLPHFVRLTPGGPCVHISMCPKTECGENEVFRECGPICEKCGIYNCRMVHCEHRCYCKEGYKRNNEGKCIPEDECPPKPQCAGDEELSDSGPEEEYCLHEEGEIVSNSTKNITQCYCREGFKRNGLGRCIPEKYCPSVKCIGLETYQSCPRKCNTTCRGYGDADCIEDEQCYPGCFCPEGLLMNDYRICVPLEKCPPGSNPFVPTLPPAVETTIPSGEGEQESEGTTPTTDTDENSEKSANSEAVAEAEAVAESDDGELPENLPDEDIESADEAEKESEAQDEEKK